MSQVGKFIHVVLALAQEDRATELVLGTTSPAGSTSIKFKVDGVWQDLPPFPSPFRPDVVTELERLAKLQREPFPKRGVLDLQHDGVRLKWAVEMTSADSECSLRNIEPTGT